MGNDPGAGAARGRTRVAELCRLRTRWRAGRSYGHRGQSADAVFRAAARDCDRARRTARRAQCRFSERHQRQYPRIRRNASRNGDAPSGGGRAGTVRTGRAASGVRPRTAARVYSRRRDFVPRRAGCDADALPTRLAYHRDLRDGAAAACARLLGLDAQRIAWALGHAATQSASLVESIGSMAKSLGVGNAAKNGLAAALFAEAGFSGPDSPIEGRYGFAAVTSDSADLARIADGIGQHWEVLNNAYKPYPCGVVLFPVIDACLELRARLAPETEAIDRVVVRGHPLMRERTDRPNVETGRDAKVSLQHTVAAAFLFAAAGLAQYEDDCVADPAVSALRARIAFEEDPGAPVESATVTLYLADGTEQSEHIRHGRGTPGRPMSDAELDSKVRELAAYGSPFVDANGLIAAVRGIEGEADPTRLMRLTVPA